MYDEDNSSRQHRSSFAREFYAAAGQQDDY